MALPAAGTAISADQINAELGRAAGTAVSFNGTTERDLADVPTAGAAISMSNFHGKTRATVAVASVSGNGNDGTYFYINYTVAAGCTTTGAWASGGSGISVTRMSNTQYRFYAGGAGGYSRSGTYRVTATPTAGGVSAFVDRAMTLTEYYDTGGGCCFTGDSLVTMWDGSLKRIDEIQPGDWVKTPFGYSEVDWIRLPMLADRPLLSMVDGKCKTSGEHNIWAKHPITGEQWWATRDMERWAFERDYELGPGLNGQEPIDLIALGCTKATYATEQGWKETEWYTVEEATPDTQLYHLYLKDHASYFVDGFLVIGELPRFETTIDWNQFSWNPENPQQPVYMTYDYELPEVDRSAFKRIVRVETEDTLEE